MRFKHGFTVHIIWLPLGIWLVKSLVLGIQGKLGAYIHPRFFSFTILATVLALSLMIVSLLAKNTADHSHSPRSKSIFSIQAVALLLVSFATAMMPPLTLSAASVINRSNESYSANKVKISARYDQFNIKEWSSLLVQSNDPLSFIGKPVKLEGFISRHNTEQKPALVSRFGVTCCAIDAQPISVPIQSDEVNNLPINQWVSITGTWKKDARSESGISIVTTAIQPIDQPKEPYVY